MSEHRNDEGPAPTPEPRADVPGEPRSEHPIAQEPRPVGPGAPPPPSHDQGTAHTQTIRPGALFPPAGSPPGSPPHGPFGQPIPGAPIPPSAYPQGTLPQATLTAPVTARKGSRLRLGVTAVALAALLGGAAGAGVTALVNGGSDTGDTSTSASTNIDVKNAATATEVTAAAAKAMPSTVTIAVTTSNAAGTGSGVILSADGYVLTNNHVVTLDGTGQGTIQVKTSDGRVYDATVVGTDPSSDLAVIKLKDASDLTPATFADSAKVQVGDVAVAIGAPLDLSGTVTNGIVSSLNRAVSVGSDSSQSVIDAIQTDAPINPGNSGGPLVNANGEVIGINSAIASVDTGASSQSSQSGNIGVGFAIPGNYAKQVADELIKDGKAEHAYLGVSAGTAGQDQQSQSIWGNGAQLVNVEAGGPAANAGLAPGDVVTEVGDRPVTSSEELTVAIRSHNPGDQVELTYTRNGQTQTATVTLGTAPSSTQ